MSFLHHSFDPGMAPPGKSAVEVWYATLYDFWEELARDRRRYEEEKKRIADLTIAELDKRWPGFAAQIAGTGAEFIVPLWAETFADEIQTISTQEAMEAARHLARHEGIFAGTSTGGNVAVALWVAERLGPGQTVVTVEWLRIIWALAPRLQIMHPAVCWRG